MTAITDTATALEKAPADGAESSHALSAAQSAPDRIICDLALFGPDSGWSSKQVVWWINQHGRRLNRPGEFATGLSLALEAAGAPIDRLRLAAKTIHPQISAWSVTWTSTSGATSTFQAQHGLELTDAFIGSPIEWVYRHGRVFRRHLADLNDSDHTILHELAAEGYTDYACFPVYFSIGLRSQIIVSTRRAGGFTDDDMAKFEALIPHLSPSVELIATRRVMIGLLDTYVGPRTSARVLDGQIKRGDGEIIDAALWFSDVRDFTRLTETLPSHEVLGMLNAYFGLVSDAVTVRGGEILRFIGDAMLIVFPAERSGKTSACQNALDSALDAFTALDVLNSRRRRASLPEITFGLGLHVGEVIYGNVGAPERLDFTVMGPAVNRTARLESLTKLLGRPLLMSRRFAEKVSQPTVSLGRHEMKGVEKPQEVYGLADDSIGRG